jgi:hypothetical protein
MLGKHKTSFYSLLRLFQFLVSAAILSPASRAFSISPAF